VAIMRIILNAFFNLLDRFWKVVPFWGLFRTCFIVMIGNQQ
jgi:hypothetical protein